MKIRQQLIGVHKLLVSFGTISLSKIGKTLGISKDSARRRCVVIKSRSHHPCATVFETEAGAQWVYLVVITAILVFGKKSGVGSETHALFFSLIGLNLFVGLSASSIDKIKGEIDHLLAKFGDLHDARVMEKAKELNLCIGADETFFKTLNILLLMDLPSGFILQELFAQNRTHKTWELATLSIIQQFKSVACLVSDKAKALVKLAKVSYHCINVSDLYHMLTYVTKFMKFKFNTEIKKVQTQIKKVQKSLESKAISTAGRVEKSNAITQLENKILDIQKSQASYRTQLHNISVAVHPFNFKTSQSQTSLEVEQSLKMSAAELRRIQSECGFCDKYKYLNTFENQIEKAASQIDRWWQWVQTSSQQFGLTGSEKHWLHHVLLPVIYWQQQLAKARRPSIKKSYQHALTQAQQKLTSDPMTQNISDARCIELETWAKWISGKFQRTTSPIEGRNALLSLAYSATKGLSKEQLRSRTVIDNYFTTRSDGTTAMERFANLKPDCLITYLVNNLGELPLPRATKCRDPVIKRSVAA